MCKFIANKIPIINVPRILCALHCLIINSIITVEIPRDGKLTNLAIIVGSVGGSLLIAVIMFAILACLCCYMLRWNKKMDNPMKEKQIMEMDIITDEKMDLEGEQK